MVWKNANTVPTVFRGPLSGTHSETVGLLLEATLTCASPRCHTRWLSPCSSPAGSPGSRSAERSRSPSPRWLPPAEWGPRRCTRRDLVSAHPRSGACTETGPSGSARATKVVKSPARVCAGKDDRRRLTALAFRLLGGCVPKTLPQPLSDDSAEYNKTQHGILWIDLEMNVGVYHLCVHVCIYLPIINLSSIISLSCLSSLYLSFHHSSIHLPTYLPTYLLTHLSLCAYFLYERSQSIIRLLHLPSLLWRFW